MTTKAVAKGITRFDHNNRHGYLVRISRGGHRTNKYYADATYGGKRKALAAAKEAHARLEEELGPIESSTKDRLTNRNSTGVVGVHVAYTQDSRYPNCEYYAYCASWVNEAGKRKKISFAWNRYGQNMAWDLAVLARQKELTDREKVVAMFERRQGKKTKQSKKATKRLAKRPVGRKKVSKKKPAKKPNAKKRLVKKGLKKTVKKSAKKKAKRRAAKKTVKKKAGKRR